SSERQMIEEAARPRAIGGNLRLEEIERLKGPLVAQALHEPDLDRGAVQIAVEVEDVRLHRHPAGLVDRGTDADVGNRWIDNLADPRGGRINTVRRQQLVVGTQIRGRKSDLRSTTIASHDGAVEVILVAE